MASTLSIPPGARTALAPWYAGSLMDATPVLQGSVTGWLFGLFDQHAVTINGTVHMTPRAPDIASPDGTVLLGHELYHVVHQREVGWWRYLAGYVARWRPGHVRRGWEHPYEAPAYARSREIKTAMGG